MSLDGFQEVFFLSLASNVVSTLKGTQSSLQQALQHVLTASLPVFTPGWEVVWGPVVWKNKPDEATTGPDNVWYVAYHPKFQFEDGSVHGTYLISIAGTPPEADYVWVNQNFKVNTVADFNAWVSGGIQNLPVVVPPTSVVKGTPYIATGTVNAVHLLLTIAAPEGAFGAGTTLLDFISSVDKSRNDKFIATGASLGSALSSSLALALVSAKIISADNALTYLVAGFSPGNRGFTDLFTATFPARKSAAAKSYQGWNLNLVNTLDIAPQAWCPFRLVCPKQNVRNIPTIYGKPALPLIVGISIIFALHGLSSGAIFYPLPSQYFDGPPPAAPPKTLEEFLKIAAWQHIQAYFDEAGVTLPTLSKSEVLRYGLTEKTEDEILFDDPVIAGIEWAREHPDEAGKEVEKAKDPGEEGEASLSGA